MGLVDSINIWSEKQSRDYLPDFATSNAQSTIH